MSVTDRLTARPRAVSRRRDRHAARSVLWAESGLDRVRKCGRSATSGGLVGVKVSGGNAGFSGLQTCGSVWACPVCSAKVAAVRQGEIAAAVSAWQAKGGQVVQLTLTMRHRRGQALRTLWDGLGYAWSKTTSGHGWGSDKAAFGIAGWVRVVEVTHGCSGWHVHIHALLFTASASFLPVSDVGASLFARWRDALLRKGFEAPLAGSGGLDVKVLTGDASNLGDYFTKAVYSASDRAGLEVARGDLKDGRHCGRCGSVHRQPFRILGDVLVLGVVDDLEAWHEWERASHGRRQLTWSKGIRAALIDQVERDDEAIAAEDHGGDVVVLLPRETWRWVRSVAGAPCDLLEAAEAGSWASWLDARGLAWESPPG